MPIVTVNLWLDGSVIDAPFIGVQIPYPNSNPWQVEKEVVKPVEEALATLPGGTSPAQSAAPTDAPLRDVVVVGNNWDGTADIFDPHTYQIIKRLDIVPDRAERIAEIESSFVRSLYFKLIRKFIGEDHDQFVDDMFTSNDGTTLYVSRPSFADVVAIDGNLRRPLRRQQRAATVGPRSCIGTAQQELADERHQGDGGTRTARRSSGSRPRPARTPAPAAAGAR